MLSDIELCQMLSSRLCHEFAGVVGAINNAAEFINSDNMLMQKKAEELLHTSTQQMMTKLQFYRIVYGITKAAGEADLDELSSLARSLLENSRITLDFPTRFFHLPEVFISIEAGKALMCIVVSAGSSLLHGGNIAITLEKKTSGHLMKITASGERMKFDISKQDILLGNLGNLNINSYNVHEYYTSILIKKAQHKLTITNQTDFIEYILEN